MPETFPIVPIGPEQLKRLVAAMLVYRRYRQQHTPATRERGYTLLILNLLLPRLHHSVEPTGPGSAPLEGTPLFLTTEEIRVIKAGLATLLDLLTRKPTSRAITQEIRALRALKTLLEQNFTTTQD